jgi:hypothetical protein
MDLSFYTVLDVPDKFPLMASVAIVEKSHFSAGSADISTMIV